MIIQKKYNSNYDIKISFFGFNNNNNFKKYIYIFLSKKIFK